MKNLKYIVLSLFSLLAVTSCQEEDLTFGDITTPANIQIDVDIAGADIDNPNGDGTGIINLTTSADNALSIHYKILGETVLADGNGSATYRFTELGLNTYTITVIVFGTGGNSSSQSIDVDVLSLFEAPEALLAKIEGLTFRIKAELGGVNGVTGHFGLGPIGGSGFGEFFSAGAFDKSESGMYDDRYIFNADGTFTHITNSENDDPIIDTSGTVFGRQNLIDELNEGPGNAVGADIEQYAYSDFSGNWQLIPFGDEGVALRLSGLGFIGYYVGGDHTYELFQWDDVNLPNEDLVLRTTDGNNEFDWWFRITSSD
ncbi:Ig-like domain-containing protein [uncultured Winogradskyella sp.]|uniref:Ig-like domain-containing protein n=1 Tax=uncultured Winogradskyella sp. TaxID=395353 RepID=UPI0026080ADE|nr:Ig-like domain-containing protein [uncultured Winogradskyella sp.]